MLNLKISLALQKDFRLVADGVAQFRLGEFATKS